MSNVPYYFVKVKCGKFCKRLRFADYYSALDYVYDLTHNINNIDLIHIEVCY